MIPSGLLFQSGAGEPAVNMAVDEALLEAMPRLGKTVLRFYSWTEKAASFGYFQKYAEVERMTSLRPLVRRPTGGGIVPHDSDWTYSLVVPARTPWYELTAIDSYRRMHEWIRIALAKIGLETELAGAGRKVQPGQCFQGNEKFDLLWNGRKIAGAAQRRTRQGLLIQGSVQPPAGLDRAAWQMAMCEVAELAPGGQWAELKLDQALTERVQELAQNKYSQHRYNKRR